MEPQHDETTARRPAADGGPADVPAPGASSTADRTAAPTQAQLLLSVAVNVALGIATAVVVLGAPVVSAAVGGIGAGAVLVVWLHLQRSRKGPTNDRLG